MHKMLLLLLLGVCLSTCQSEPGTDRPESGGPPEARMDAPARGKHVKPFDPDLPTVGLLLFDGVLQVEVVATSDVFAKADAEGKQLFNVVSIAETDAPVVSEEGLTFVPDYTFANSPELTALFVPSAFDMYAQVNNERIINFIQSKNEEAEYVVSNCAGARLIGASGIADGHKIVTWVGGGEQLQKDYPKLKVQDDRSVSFVTDGKFSSSNGNLASYISALEVLEQITGPEHRQFVENSLYLGQLRAWP
ncbi:DJ-1/PfpI family protein [Lewinella sp. IMCC34191]|uniref:DJ-1/PfpI family protein n=1 Tax=Lewinella sp. IMCC34191 TaxID=2259172 RepID=UPI000E2437F6|nr:DJ-1/PfpI family protein [Lewinella sp. IMCC34191]